MKKARDIHNLDSLEREIYRLKLQVKNMEERLDHNLEHLQENFSSMTMNSFFRKRQDKDDGKGGFFGSFLKNEKLSGAINKITDHLAERAAEGIEELIEKIFHKKKHHSDE